MAGVPFTERSNPITENIDISASNEIVDLLSQTDAELFMGSPNENLFSTEVIESISGLANLIRHTFKMYQPQDVAIVLAGCGTSGRLGFLLSKVCNNLSECVDLGRPFFYSIAGGDKSLLTSQEAPEDDPKEGISSLTKICVDKKKVIYVGITCGISAPFVGGQLEWCMKNSAVYFPVLLGFNRIDMARNIEIPGWGKSMRDVAQNLDRHRKDGKAIIINPILGAEPITGSSRMKGGTATKIVLETAFLSALNWMERKSSDDIPSQMIRSVLTSYQNLCKKFYADQNSRDVIAKAIESAGRALKSGGAIRYLSSGWTGVVPVIDSTECPPTFGSSVDDVRGFLDGGYDFLGIEDYGKENESFRLGTSDFIGLYKKREAGNDQVFVFLQETRDPLIMSLRNDLGHTLKRLKGVKKIVAIILGSTNLIDIEYLSSFFDEVFQISCPEIDASIVKDWGFESCRALLESRYALCLKYIVNAISTGSHVMLGKIYKNYMCDVKVSNNKLYHRAIGIIQIMCNASYDEARDALLKSVYEINSVGEDKRNLPVSEHYKTATPKDKVVPLAIILAKQKCSIDQAKSILGKYPIVRNAILEMTTAN